MNLSFNLVEERWIPCIDGDNNRIERSLYEVLIQAHELREIYDESPLVTASIHRLLLAILHRIFGPKNPKDWNRLWQRGQWPHEPIDDYFAQWEHRFDLFDAERPFYQAEDERVKKPRSVIHLIHSSGNNPTLFNHHTDDAKLALLPSEAARATIVAHAYRLSGRVAPEVPNFVNGICTRGALFIVQGNTLFETLCLNLIRYPDAQAFNHSDRDRPAWEMNDPFSPERSIPYGYLDYLTWQTVRVKLEPEWTSEGIVVRQMTMGPGLSISKEILDLMKHYTKQQQGGYRPLPFSLDKALWRDSSALVALGHQNVRPPMSFRWLSDLIYDGYLVHSTRYQYMALGMASEPKKSKVEFYRHERMPLPLAYLGQPELAESLIDEAALADKIAQPLGRALTSLARSIVAPNADKDKEQQKDEKKKQQRDKKQIKDSTDNILKHWNVTEEYWSTLELEYRQLVKKLPISPDEAVARWRNSLRDAAIKTFDHAQEMAGSSGPVLRAATRARGRLLAGITKILK